MDFKKYFLRFTSFSIVGLIVTLFSMLLIYLFIGVMKTPLYLSYAMIYLLSIFISYLLNLKFVFKIRKSQKNILKYYVTYGSSMVIGLISLKLFKLLIPLDDWLLAYFVLPVTLTWNFIMLSFLLKKDKK